MTDEEKYLNAIYEAEYQEAYDFCMVEPTDSEVDGYLSRFAGLSRYDQMNAIIKSKEWIRKKLTQKMEQIINQ